MELQKRNNRKNIRFNGFDYLNLFLAITSLLIAIIALGSLTKVEGFENLLIRTGENNKIMHQVLVQLVRQDSSQQKLLEDNLIQVEELKGQTTSLLKLVDANRKQLYFQSRRNKSELIRNFFEIRYVMESFDEFNFLINHPILFNENKEKEIIDLMHKMKIEIENGVKNDMVKLNDEIYCQWWVFDQRLDFILDALSESNFIEEFFNISNHSGYIIETNMKKDSLNDKTERQELLQKFKRYTNIFYSKGIIPISKTKEYAKPKGLYKTVLKNNRN